MPRPHKPSSPFRYFNSSPEVMRLVVLMYVLIPLSLRNVEDLLFERGVDISHETVRLWWNRFGPMLAGDIRRARVSRMRGFRHWRWHLDEMHVKLNGEMVYLTVLRTCSAKLRTGQRVPADEQVRDRETRHRHSQCSWFDRTTGSNVGFLVVRSP